MKNKFMKRVLGCALALAMVVTAVQMPMTAKAADTNVAQGKTVTVGLNTRVEQAGVNQVRYNPTNNLEKAVDGKKDNTNSHLDFGVSNGSSEIAGCSYMQVDLGTVHNITSMKLWRYFNNTYTNTVIVVAETEAGFDETVGEDCFVVYNADENNVQGFGIGTEVDYKETAEGKEIPFSEVQGQYVRVYMNGTETGTNQNHIVELEVYGTDPNAPVNVAFEKDATVGLNTRVEQAEGNQVRYNTSQNVPSRAVDGEKGDQNYHSDFGVSNGSSEVAGCSYLQVDLGAVYDITSMKLWRYFGNTYTNTVIVVAETEAGFNGTVGEDCYVVYNADERNVQGFGIGTEVDYTETAEGKEINFNAVRGQYVRVYMNGTESGTSQNHVVELEVYGKEYVAPETPAEFKFASASLTLQSDLTMNFTVAPEVFKDYTDITVTINDEAIEGKDGVYSFENIGPHMMGDDFKAVLTGKYNGEPVSYDYTLKVLDYANYQFENSNDEELKSLLMNLLEYGAKSQASIGYKTDTLVTAGLTGAQTGYISDSVATLDDVTNVTKTEGADYFYAWSSASLYLKDSISMKFTFATEAAVDGIKAVVTMNGKNYDASIVPTATGYCVNFDQLNAAQLRDTVTVKLVDGSGDAVSETLTYSVASYASQVLAENSGVSANVKTLAEAMMKYGDAAAAYVN